MNRARPRRFFVEWLLVAAASIALVTGLAAGHALWRVDGLVYDSLLKLVRTPTPDDVIIVAIDDRSLGQLGAWPWSRVRHAQLIDRLAQAHPAAVLYDVLFLEPQPTQDPALAAALKRAGRVYLPLLIAVPGLNGAAYQVNRPTPQIDQAAAGTGQTNIHPDRDGIVRRAFLVEGDAGRLWPHLTTTVAGVLGAVGRSSPPRFRGPALQAGQEVMIPYIGPPGSVRTVPFAAVLNGEVPGAFFRDKLVLVGATAAGLGDRFPTPVGVRANDMAGVEILANLYEAQARGRMIRPVGLGWTLAVQLAALAALLTGFLTLRPRANLLMGLGLSMGALVLSLILMAGFHLWLPVAALLFGIGAAYPLWGWRRLEASSAYMIEELERLRREPGLPRAAGAGAPSGDVVERQMTLLEDAVAGVRDLRRFVSDTLENLPDAVLVTDEAGQVLMASAAAMRLMDRLAVAPDARGDLAGLLGRLRAAAGEAGAPATTNDDEVVAPDGGWFQLRRAPILSHAGARLGWILRLSDITAIRQAERQREDLLQVLTHDMRSPQVSILALLDQAPAAPADPDLPRRIRALANRTLALADGFVRLARAEFGPARTEILDLNDVLAEAVDEVWPQATAKGVALEAPFAEDAPLVAGDQGLLARTLINLIGNAVRHSPQGGRIRCEIAVEGRDLVCAVIDQGPGLEPALQDRIFERFASGHGAQRLETGGVGLGLAFAQTAARRHGGRISYAATAGGGATFRLVLPIAAEATGP